MAEENVTHEQPLDCMRPYEISPEQWVWYDEYSWWMEGFTSLLIGSSGILLNITTICVLLGSVLGASFFNWLLVFLALFDSLFLLNGILEAFRSHLGKTSFHDYVFVNFLYPFRSVVMCCSMYMTVLLALERYNALARPTCHQSSTSGPGQNTLSSYFKVHWIRLIKYVGPIIALSTIFYIPKYMELHLNKNDKCDNTNDTDNCSEFVVDLTELRKSNSYVLWYLNVTNLVVTTIIPLLSLAYLNFNVYLKFKQYIHRQPSTMRSKSATSNVQEKFRKREKDMVQQTMILFVIVISFGLSHVLRIVLNIEELKSLDDNKKAQESGCEWLKFWTIIVAPISHLLLQINSGINFFIYCFFNKAFRDVLLSKLCVVFNMCKCKRQINNSRSGNSPARLNQQTGTTDAHATVQPIELENINLINVEA